MGVVSTAIGTCSESPLPLLSLPSSNTVVAISTEDRELPTDVNNSGSGDSIREEEEQLLTELSIGNRSKNHAVVSPDKLSVKQEVKGGELEAVQANKPAPVKVPVYYFEMRVKNAGSSGRIAIGFTKQSRWKADSIGYHGDDGLLYRGGKVQKPFGPTFTTRDKVGAGINYGTNEFFFTKNGAMVGAVPKEIDGLLFPTVGVHSKNEEIEVNFGQKPFAFRIKENEGWVFIIIAMALLIEVVSAVFEQLGRSLAGMVAAYVGLAVCVVDLRRKAKRERVVWQRRGLIPWYYSRFPNHKLFGSVADYFEVFATVGQSLQSTMGYVFARWHMGNPVRISINMLLFGIFVLVAKLVNKFPVLFNPPPRYHQHNP